jgi:hypothetical protein
VTVWETLACHEVGHLLGFADITAGGITGSKAGCMGAASDFQGPGIDDQMNLPAIYAAPAGS